MFPLPSIHFQCPSWSLPSHLPTAAHSLTPYPCLSDRWPKTECLCSSSGLIPAHSYFGTRVRIDPPSMTYGLTISNQSSTHTEPYTTDNGLHWFVDRIDMEESWCENNDPCPDPEDVQSATA